MAVKYYYNPKKRGTIAVLTETRYDFLNKANKMLANTGFVLCSDKYLMKNEYKGIVYCNHDDVYDDQLGKELAKKKCLDRYYRDFDKLWGMLQEELLVVNGKFFETPENWEETT